MFSQCCQPCIQGKKKVATAETLLRSRYTAFVIGDVDYIIRTQHSRTKDQAARDEIETWAKQSEWHGFTLIQTEGGAESDSKGILQFCAKYRPHNEKRVREHYENALFEKENGEWRFVDSEGYEPGVTLRRTEPKIGRNDPCTCGSGKKFKKCCGANA